MSVPPSRSASPSPSPLSSPSIRPDHAGYAVSSTSQTERPSHFPAYLGLNGPGDQNIRRPSIQFATRTSETGVPTGSPKPVTRRRNTSPPPPTAFKDRVSFDTFDNKDASTFSLTLNSKHKDYEYTRRSRTFLCGTDQNDYSEFALEWLIDELTDDGDEIVCLRVIDKDSKITSDASVEEGRYRLEAKKLLDQVIEKNTEEKAISLVLEFAVGKVHETIQRMIRIYEPAILIVGTRGRSLGGLQGLLPGSVSKYCLQHSPVPVIVVRPTYKREKKKKKRQADPTRKGYMDILERSGTKGTHVLDHDNRDSLVDAAPEAGFTEAAAVADAIGLPRDITADPTLLTRVQSAKSDLTSPESPSPTGGLTPDPRSPSLDNLDSPSGSSGEEGDFEAVSGYTLAARHNDTDDEDLEVPKGVTAKDSLEDLKSDSPGQGGVLIGDMVTGESSQQ
ncbi:MAG: hypothetical protein M1812_002597 [Candelaria pacifica]|nr:MAG: hypothetical protein M1812_002597 [Candelaria pacifica]